MHVEPNKKAKRSQSYRRTMFFPWECLLNVKKRGIASPQVPEVQWCEWKRPLRNQSLQIDLTRVLDILSLSESTRAYHIRFLRLSLLALSTPRNKLHSYYAPDNHQHIGLRWKVRGPSWFIYNISRKWVPMFFLKFLLTTQSLINISKNKLYTMSLKLGIRWTGFAMYGSETYLA